MISLRKKPLKEYIPHFPREPALVHKGLAATMRKLRMDELPSPLLIVGPTGVGKTCACLCLCDYVDRSVYATAQEHSMNRIAAQKGQLTTKAPCGDVSVSETGWWNTMQNSALVVIDELGWRLPSDPSFHIETIKGILDRRGHRPTIMTSNRSLEQLATLYGEATISRVRSGTTFVFPENSADLRASRSITIRG